MTTLTLTQGQQSALDAFTAFLVDPLETAFVLSGYSGTGKTTLVKALLDKLPNIIKAAKLINPSLPEYEIALTATTNKAAETLQEITNHPVTTIHSFLSLRVVKDYLSGNSHLEVSKKAALISNSLIFIDESSYVDKALLSIIFKRVVNSKIVFMGDPAQLTPVKSNATPVFDANFKGACLTEVVRQSKDNPITDLATKFRNTVNTGEFFSFTPDGNAVNYLDRDAFNTHVIQEFTRTGWTFNDSKILAWTNKRATEYNHFVNENLSGSPHFNVGDYAVCNNFLSCSGTVIKTDQMVRIDGIQDGAKSQGVSGKYYTIMGRSIFGPNSLNDRKQAIQKAKADEDYMALREIDTSWIDLRAAYACTINKAQGSTYDRVFIDLDDIRKCNSGDQIARMLYVAVSRARYQVFLTGDIA